MCPQFKSGRSHQKNYFNILYKPTAVIAVGLYKISQKGSSRMKKLVRTSMTYMIVGLVAGVFTENLLSLTTLTKQAN